MPSGRYGSPGTKALPSRILRRELVALQIKGINMTALKHKATTPRTRSVESPRMIRTRLMATTMPNPTIHLEISEIRSSSPRASTSSQRPGCRGGRREELDASRSGLVGLEPRMRRKDLTAKTPIATAPNTCRVHLTAPGAVTKGAVKMSVRSARTTTVSTARLKGSRPHQRQALSCQ